MIFSFPPLTFEHIKHVTDMKTNYANFKQVISLLCDGWEMFSESHEKYYISKQGEKDRPIHPKTLAMLFRDGIINQPSNT